MSTTVASHVSCRHLGIFLRFSLFVRPRKSSFRSTFFRLQLANLKSGSSHIVLASSVWFQIRLLDRSVRSHTSDSIDAVSFCAAISTCQGWTIICSITGLRYCSTNTASCNMFPTIRVLTREQERRILSTCSRRQTHRPWFPMCVSCHHTICTTMRSLHASCRADESSSQLHCTNTAT